MEEKRMEKKQGFLKKFLVVMIAVFSLTLLSPEVATQLGTMQTVQAAVKISSKKLTLTKGQKKTLKLKGTKKKVKWSSSKKSVASVSSKGVVTAKKKGTATITAKVGNKKYTCKVTVKDNKKPTVTPKPTTTSSKYQKVVDYITNHGELNSDYNYFISVKKKSSDTTYIAAIEYDEDIKALNFILISNMEFELGSGNTALGVTIKNNATSADVDYVWIYSHQYGTNAVEMEAILNPKTYSGLSDINFKVISNTGNLSYKNINGLANTTLQVGFNMWQSLLEKKIGVELQNIGFTAYIG